MREDIKIESKVPQAGTREYQIDLMKNIEKSIFKTTRNRLPNWKLVQKYLTGFTIRGGSTSAHIHCEWLGVDPSGYTFFQ